MNEKHSEIDLARIEQMEISKQYYRPIIQALELQVKEFREVIEFYADKNNWDGFDEKFQTDITPEDWDVVDAVEYTDGIGGKKARAVLLKHPEQKE